MTDKDQLLTLLKEQEAISIIYKNHVLIALENYEQSLKTERELWAKINQLWVEGK